MEAADPPISLNCTVEEEKIMKGVELIFSDRLNEAEEYFEAMKPGSLRYSLYHAEVATYVALISSEEKDLQIASTLLSETEAVAGQLAQKYRTHSNIRKMNAAVISIKTWALGRFSRKYSASATPAKVTPVEAEDGQEGDTVKLEEKVQHHRFRRARLWALQIQAECYLMSSILQIVGAGEVWSSVVKVGYSLRRTWGLYQHCRNKLRQLTREWIAMEGTFDFRGDPKSIEGDEDYSSDEDDDVDEDMHTKMKGTDHMEDLPSSMLPSQSENFGVSGSFLGDGRPSPSASLQPNEDFTSDDSNSYDLLVLDGKKCIKEDAELRSLQLGIQFGEGAFNLILSLIPSAYQKALEVMRFPANRERGIALLRKCCTANHPVTPIASIMLLYYHTAIMGLLPYSSEHARQAHELLNKMPDNWKSCLLFRVLASRLERYERNLGQATSRVIISTDNPYTIRGKGSMRKLRCLTLDELGWCLLLQGKFYDAANCFGTLLQESICFKPHYAFLQSACLWEASENAHLQAGQLLKEIPALVGSKKQQQLTPLEQYALQISSKFGASNQAPLFSALELAAICNGFQFMDKTSLELHIKTVEEVLQGRTQPKASSNNSEDSIDLLSGGSPATSTINETISKPSLHYEHKWTKSSKMISRFLLGVCQKNLGEIQKADDNFRYVIENSESYCGNIVPYSCYELASMLLQHDPSSPDGLRLLEQSLSYPSHEFQGRLKLIVGELLRRYGTSSAGIEVGANVKQGNVRRVSDQFKAKLSLQDSEQ